MISEGDVRGARRRWRLALAVVALLLTGCPAGGPPRSAPAQTETDPAAPPGGTRRPIVTDVGVSEEPCPDSPARGRGCIRLGVLSESPDGPFAAYAGAMVEGQRAYWDWVNRNGGIAQRYDVDAASLRRDTGADPERHVRAFLELEPEILALAHTFGTEATIAAIGHLDDADVVAVPATPWSGWSDAAHDRGLVLESGASPCLETATGLEWAQQAVGPAAGVLVVAYDDADGRDAAAGAAAWADARGIEDRGPVLVERGHAHEQHDRVVQAVLAAAPDRVHLATGAADATRVVEQLTAQGYQGLFLGGAASWDPGLDEEPGNPEPLRALYHRVTATPFRGETPAHEELRAEVDASERLREEVRRHRDGFAAGWLGAAPLRASLERAVERGDLTRAGLRVAAAEQVGGDGASPDPPTVTISRPDPDARGRLRDLEAGVPAARDVVPAGRRCAPAVGPSVEPASGAP